MEKKEKYDSVHTAKYLLAIAYSENIVLNVTKVQKLLYIAYGYFLSEKGRILLSEAPRAWPYGPVFPNTRKDVDFSKIIPLDSDEFVEIEKDKDVTEFFELLVKKYSKYTAFQLSEWSHAEGGPWDLITKRPNFNWDDPISDDLIKKYFSNLRY